MTSTAAMTTSAPATGAAPAAAPAYPGQAGGFAAAPAATTAAPTASLYVGELHPDVTEAVLYELFSQVGPVSSIRVCRDAITRRSLGYAYVNFHTASDCERALETLNYAPIKGQPCRIMWSQRDPATRRSGVGNVFIKNLDKSIDNKSLYDTFSAFGHILSCKIVTDEQGDSKGYGYVHFETRDAADQAIAKVNGMLLNGIKVYVGHHISRKERRSKLEEMKAQFTNIFVKNLDEAVSEEKLKKSFEAFGEIQSCFIQRDEQGKSRGFGFINFVDHESAQKAVDAMNNAEYEGRTIFVGRAQKKSERTEELRRQFESLKMERMNKFHGVNLYVKNIDENVNEDQLRLEFTPFGNITSLKIMTDEAGRSRGFGFVCYSAPEEAARAIQDANGRMVNGKPLYVALAQRREERRAQLENQFAQRQQQLRMQNMAGMNIYQQGPLFYPPGASRFAPPTAFGVNRPPVNAAGFMPPAQASGANVVYGGQPMVPGMRPSNRPMRGGYRNGPMPGMNGGAPFQGQQPGFRRPYNNGGRFNGPRGARPDFSGAEPAPLTIAMLAAAPADQQKRILGERLFPLVRDFDAVNAAKLTGMLLEMDNGEVLHLLESPESLAAKIAEAQEVLRQHQGGAANGAVATATEA